MSNVLVERPAGSVAVQVPDLHRLSKRALRDMKRAAAEISECVRVLAKTGDNVVSDILRGQGDFYEYSHYPPGDVIDAETHSQYYYHAHREDEHGHFHTFLRRPGMPKNVVALGDAEDRAAADTFAHLAGVSMDEYGVPKRLFAVNRWVSDDTWFSAADTIRMLDRFQIDQGWPSWPTNRWLSALIRLYRHHIAALLKARDDVLAERMKRDPLESILEDRELDEIVYMPISVDHLLEQLDDLPA